MKYDMLIKWILFLPFLLILGSISGALDGFKKAITTCWEDVNDDKC
jgi:hypothetical protein